MLNFIGLRGIGSKPEKLGKYINKLLRSSIVKYCKKSIKYHLILLEIQLKTLLD